MNEQRRKKGDRRSDAVDITHCGWLVSGLLCKLKGNSEDIRPLKHIFFRAHLRGPSWSKDKWKFEVTERREGDRKAWEPCASLLKQNELKDGAICYGVVTNQMILLQYFLKLFDTNRPTTKEGTQRTEECQLLVLWSSEGRMKFYLQHHSNYGTERTIVYVSMSVKED